VIIDYLLYGFLQSSLQQLSVEHKCWFVVLMTGSVVHCFSHGKPLIASSSRSVTESGLQHGEESWERSATESGSVTESGLQHGEESWERCVLLSECTARHVCDVSRAPQVSRLYATVTHGTAICVNHTRSLSVACSLPDVIGVIASSVSLHRPMYLRSSDYLLSTTLSPWSRSLFMYLLFIIEGVSSQVTVSPQVLNSCW